VSDVLLEKGVYISVKVISHKDYIDLKNTHFILNIEREGVLLG